MADGSATDKDMITVITEECNEISQEFYDDAMDSIQICQLECSCGHCGCLAGHGAYTRSIKTALGKIPLVIRRVQCSLCNAIHALTKPCIRFFGRQSMQIKNTRNLLFVPPT